MILTLHHLKGLREVQTHSSIFFQEDAKELQTYIRGEIPPLGGIHTSILSCRKPQETRARSVFSAKRCHLGCKSLFSLHPESSQQVDGDSECR